MSMLRPLLIIGVGGSGGKTLRAMKQALTRKLEAARYEGGIPAAWQFLHIDITYDGIGFPAPMLRADEFHCVVPRGASFNDILMSITNKGTLADQQSMLAGWGVQTSSSPITPSPSQMRAIGRQVGVADSAETLTAIRSAITKMQAPTAFAELASVARALGGEDPKNSAPRAFIISSLAGGSGAGMFMDVAELLKRATNQNWAQEAVALLYTADVFRSLGAAGSHVAKNSLGVMNELIASKWVGISERSELLYSKLGLVADNPFGDQSYGCKLNLLFGAESSSYTFHRADSDIGGMDDFLLNVGEALAGAISDDEISDFFLEIAVMSLFGNRNSPQLDISGLAPESVNFDHPTLTAAGIGFGQMALGADRVVNYVADAMTRAQVEQLLWPELDSMILKEGVSPSGLIQDRADQVWSNFLVDSGLDTRGSRNHIVDSLFPDQLQELIRQTISGLIEKIISATPQSIASFSKSVWSEWETESDTFLKFIKIEIDSRAQTWVPEIQEKLLDLMATELASNGYAVVSNLTERLEKEIREHVIPEFIRDHTEFVEAVSGFDQRAFGDRLVELADGLSGVSNQNSAFLEKITSSLGRVLEFHVNAYVSNLAASLVEDLLGFFFKPLKNGLAESRLSLHMQQRETISPDGSRNVFPEFPVWGSGDVPIRYKSRTMERILVDYADYESTYELYASKDLSGAPAFQQSASSALLGKKLNQLPGDINEQTLITVGSRWTTSMRDGKTQADPALNNSDWKFHTDLAELSENNRRWLRIRDSSFGKFTDMSIHDFVLALGESPIIRHGREVEFKNAFGEMIRMASPFVKLNLPAVSRFVVAPFGGSAYGTILESSRIPFAIDSNVGQACVDVLQQHGVNSWSPAFAGKWFDAGSKASTMFAVATHRDSLPAWAFASLTEPILEQVAQSKNSPQTWDQFWDGRRSRPLVECIPFETEMRRSIITGWFVARLFGLIEIDFDKKTTRELVDKRMSPEVASFLRSQGLDVEVSVGQKEEVTRTPASSSMWGRSVRAWNPTLQIPGWSSFPNPLLPTHREDERRHWVLPQLLVSAGIALAEFGHSGDPEFIYGYRLLKYLGREVTTTFNGRDHWDGWGLSKTAGDALPTGAISQSTYIKDWVITGRKPDESLDLSPLLQSELDKAPDRQAALIATVEKLRAEYAAAWVDYSSVEWQKLPETWELKEDIDLAFGDIIRFIEELQEGNESSQID
jgi:hypothetical protein